MNIRGIMKKLQAAILTTGLVVGINTIQFYSEDQKRMITVFRLTTPITYYSEQKCKWEKGEYEILSTSSGIDIIHCLSDIYKAVKI